MRTGGRSGSAARPSGASPAAATRPCSRPPSTVAAVVSSVRLANGWLASSIWPPGSTVTSEPAGSGRAGDAGSSVVGACVPSAARRAAASVGARGACGRCRSHSSSTPTSRGGPCLKQTDATYASASGQSCRTVGPASGASSSTAVPASSPAVMVPVSRPTPRHATPSGPGPQANPRPAAPHPRTAAGPGYPRPVPRVSAEQLAARRAQILDGARECFARHGYEGATVRRLEQSVGLSRGAIFHHFRDKEALFLAVAEQDTLQMADL